MFRFWKKTIPKEKETEEDINTALEKYEANIEKKLDDVDETIEFEKHIKDAASQLERVNHDKKIEKDFEDIYLSTKKIKHEQKKISPASRRKKVSVAKNTKITKPLTKIRQKASSHKNAKKRRE